MSQNKAIDVEIDGHVAWLNLCRPERQNAMGMTFFKEVTGHFERLDEDPTVRAVVIRAEGKSFTAGLDLMEAGAMLGGKGTDDREHLRKTIVELQESNNAIERCRKPVIAAVHGHCIGGGVDLLSACDIRLASADALFSIRGSPSSPIWGPCSGCPTSSARGGSGNWPSPAETLLPMRLFRWGLSPGSAKTGRR